MGAPRWRCIPKTLSNVRVARSSELLLYISFNAELMSSALPYAADFRFVCMSDERFLVMHTCPSSGSELRLS